MKKNTEFHLWRFAAGVAMLCLLLQFANVQPVIADDSPASFTIMTANIRAAMPTDKDEVWQNRRELLVRTMLKYQPDIVGFQEVTPAQGAYLVARMEGYTRVTEQAPESAPAGLLDMGDALASLNQIFFKIQRLKLIAAKRGTLRPDVAATNFNENACYAMAVLADQKTILPNLVVFDTHLRHDTVGATKSCENLQAIMQQQLQARPGAAAIVLGDMNHDRSDPAIKTLAAGDGHAESMLADTFHYADKLPRELWGTYHGFTGKSRALWPTDLIFITHGLQATPAVIVRDQDPATGRWPSDHFFVLTTIEKPH